MKIKKRYFARKRTISKISNELKEISDEFVKLFYDEPKIEIVETDKGIDIILVDGEPAIFRMDNKVFPTVKGAQKINIDKRFIIVDKGAVKFVAKGADVMRPGIVNFDEGINKGDLVIILEEVHKKALAIGISMWNGEEFKNRERGKCVKTIHYVGDDIWSLA
jgi:PUA domain protein